MKFNYLAVCIVIGLLLGSLLKEKKTSVVQPLPQIKKAEAPLVAKAKAVPASELRPASKEILVSPVPNLIAKEVIEPRPQPPPPGHLRFEVKEGMAVVQGDMVMGQLSEEQKDIKSGIVKAKATLLWPTREIPFSIQAGLTNRQPIERAIQYFHQNTDVRFIPYTGQKDSLVFVESQEICASFLGRVGGAQPIFVGPRCGFTEMLHELMHALGFVHEHSRADRDQYLNVLWKNIDKKYLDQFYIVPDELIHDYSGTVFDFDPESVMLYEATAFSYPEGQVTLQAKSGVELKPSRDSLSRRDRERIFYLYSR